MIIDELFEGPQLCPECGGISFSDLILAEKKDACYYKVKASAKVWPSAYASGRLVQCRKKGAANYGKSKTESVAEGSRYKCTCHPGDADPDCPVHGLEPMEVGDALDVKKGVAEQQELDEKWSQKYKSSINCANPKGFSQRAHCAGRKKNEDVAESNVFTDARMNAIKAGKDTFAVHGRTYQVTGDTKDEREASVEETRRGQIPMTLNPGETDNLEPENLAGFRQLPAYKQGQAAQQKAGKQLIQKSPYTFQSDQDWAYRQGATDAQRAAMFANFGGTKPLTTAEGEQKKGADYRDPKEVDYDGEYDAMVARVKRLAGLGPMKTVYDPTKRVYRNMPTAQQPKK